MSVSRRVLNFVLTQSCWTHMFEKTALWPRRYGTYTAENSGLHNHKPSAPLLESVIKKGQHRFNTQEMKHVQHIQKEVKSSRKSQKGLKLKRFYNQDSAPAAWSTKTTCYTYTRTSFLFNSHGNSNTSPKPHPFFLWSFCKLLLFFTPKKSREFSINKKTRLEGGQPPEKTDDEAKNRDAKDIASRWIEDVAGGIVGIPLPIGAGRA